MNLGDVQTRVKRQFGDEAGAQIEDADIARWASDAQLDIVRETKCNQTTTTQSLVDGQIEYPLASSISLSSVSVNGTIVRAASKNDLDMRFPDRATVGYPKGVPQLFAAREGVQGTIVSLFPIPDAGPYSLVVIHNTRPSPVVNPADTFTVPEEYHQIIVQRCLERAYQTDGQWSAAKAVGGTADARTTEARADSREKTEESYPAIRCLPGDQGNA